MAPVTLHPILSSNLGLPPDSYIYKIISTAPRQDPLTYSQTDQLAIISSDDSLRFLDPATLNASSVVKNVNDKVTCLERANDLPGNIVATAGRDGTIHYWDERSRQKALSVPCRMYNAADTPHAANAIDSSEAHLIHRLRLPKQFRRCRH